MLADTAAILPPVAYCPTNKVELDKTDVLNLDAMWSEHSEFKWDTYVIYSGKQKLSSFLLPPLDKPNVQFPVVISGVQCGAYLAVKE